MMKLHSKRIYDSKNRLIYELHGDYDEYINKYDDNDNLIYSKNTNLISGQLGYEFSQEFDLDGNLIHRVNIEYGVDDIFEYEPGSDIVKNISSDKDGSITQYIKKSDIVIDKIEKQTEDKTVDFLGHVSLYEYDNHGNVSKITDLDEDGNPCLEIDYENIYE